MRKFLSAIPFVLCSLLAPDLGGGGGGPAPATAPEPTGNTLEEKIASAKSIIGNFFSQVGQLTSDLAAKVQAYATLEGQFNDLRTTAETEKTAHVATKGLLDTEKAEHTKTSGKLVAAEASVKRLEGLCGLKGIDPNQTVPPAAAPGEDIVAQYNAITDPIERTTFYRNNKAAIDAAHRRSAKQ